MQLIEYQLRSIDRFILIEHILSKTTNFASWSNIIKNDYPVHISNITYMGVLIYGMIILRPQISNW
jgi:hypothetical protein